MSDVMNIVEDMTPVFRRLFLEAVADMRSEVDVARLVDLIERGQIEDAVQSLPLDPEFLGPVEDAVRSAFVRAGRETLASVDSVPVSGDLPIIVMRFGTGNEEAEQWILQRSSTLVSEISSDQRGMIRSVLSRGYAEGRNPRSVALDIAGRVDVTTGQRTGGLLGLSTVQEAYARAATEELQADSPATLRRYLTRALRDRRYDATVLRSVRTGEPLTEEQVTLIVGRYRDRLLQHRAETIARTEMIAAAHAGQTSGMRKLLRTGRVRPQQIRKIWRATPDDRTRDHHERLDETEVALDEPFISPATGMPLMHPGDSTLGARAEDTVNCRCWMETRVDWMMGAN